MADDSLIYIGIDELMPDANQPRQTFTQEVIERIAVSAKDRGILQPLRVQFDTERKCWRIISGETRWRAARLAGLASVPCVPVLGDLSEADRLSDQIVENHCRQDLKPLELARALAKLKALKGVKAQTLAEDLGLSAATLSRLNALLGLPEDVQHLVDDGLLAENSAYEVSKLPDEGSMRQLANEIVAGRLNREQVIDRVRQSVPKKKVQPKAGRVAGKAEGVSFTFSHSGGELNAETLLRAIELIRGKLKSLKGEAADTSSLAELLRAS